MCASKKSNIIVIRHVYFINFSIVSGHMAALLVAAKIIFGQRASLRGSIKLIFQPAEEGYAGARVRISAVHHLSSYMYLCVYVSMHLTML